MAVELIKDLLKIDYTIGKDYTETMVDTEMKVPEEKTINKILNVYGSVRITDSRITKDKISVDGTVDFKVLYSANDEFKSIQSVNKVEEFSEEISINGINDKMVQEIKYHIEHIESSLIDENKISLNAVLKLFGKVQAENKIDIVKNVEGTKGLQVKKENIKYNDVIGTNVNKFTVKEVFEIKEGLPDVVDVLRVNSKAYERETKVVDGKIIVAGVVETLIMYFGDDEVNKINHVTYELPFTQFIEMNGATKDMNCNLRLEVDDTSIETSEDINGDFRLVNVSSKIKVHSKVYNAVEKEVTIDTYSTEKKIDVKKEKVSISENIGVATSREIIKGAINVASENEIIKNIYNVNAKPILSDYRIIDDKVIIEGFVIADMLYVDEDSGDIRDSSIDLPFKTYVDIEGIDEGMECEADILLDDIKYNKSNSREVNVEVSIRNEVSVNRIKNIDIVTEVQETDEMIDKFNRPSITVYVVQPGDTIWNIAKRYNTTEQELIDTNDINSPENLMPGEKIIIEKNIEFEI